jgi:hypothetical protein
VARWHYDLADLYRDLTTHLVGAFEVAEACLGYATWETRGGRPTSWAPTPMPFDSENWRKLDVAGDLCRLVPITIRSGLHPRLPPLIAYKIANSENPPLAAWITAMRISVGVSRDFAASDPYGPVYNLRDLRGIAIATVSPKILYGQTEGLSTRPGRFFNHYDASAVNGLMVWRDEPHIYGPFEVIVDRSCAAQFDAAMDTDKKLKIALIQPNRSLLGLSVTKVSPEGDRRRRFFGVGPRCAKAQTKKILKGLKLAQSAGAGIALLPELVTTKDEAKKVASELRNTNNIITHNDFGHTLRVVVSGSYHHVDASEDQRNTTQVLFPRTSPMLRREISKSGEFFYPSTQAVMEAWKGSPWLFDWPAVLALIKGALIKGALIKGSGEPQRFREDIKPANKIRLFTGAQFSVVVVVCADLLNKDFRRALDALKPSLVLVCNMTEKQGDFASAAHALILACQATLVAANNPARWSKFRGLPGKRVAGAMVGMPVREGSKRVVEANFRCNKIVIFDLDARQLQRYPR